MPGLWGSTVLGIHVRDQIIPCTCICIVLRECESTFTCIQPTWSNVRKSSFSDETSTEMWDLMDGHTTIRLFLWQYVTIELAEYVEIANFTWPRSLVAHLTGCQIVAMIWKRFSVMIQPQDKLMVHCQWERERLLQLRGSRITMLLALPCYLFREHTNCLSMWGRTMRRARKLQQRQHPVRTVIWQWPFECTRCISDRCDEYIR